LNAIRLKVKQTKTRIMKIYISIFFLCISITAMSQGKDIYGTWKLVEAKSINGPNYINGIPRIINIKQVDSLFKVEIIYSKSGFDTSESETLKIGEKQVNEIITASNRKKNVYIFWDSISGDWIKRTTLSSRNDFTNTVIQISETLRILNYGKKLMIVKDYNGADEPNGNKDYSMQGIYEKISSADLSQQNASGKGIQFEKKWSWQEVLKRAKKENKYIFVDCYASWCGPCKKMERDVYLLDWVGKEFNDKFISLKVQLDSAKEDANLKFTYKYAREFEKLFNIKALPTYLFFDPLGRPIHKEIGLYGAKEFVQLSQQVLDTSVQIYTQINKAEKGKSTPDEMLLLVDKLASRKYSERALAEKIARCYIDQYLNNKETSLMFTKSNIKFITRFSEIVRSRDRIFQACYNTPMLVDSITGQQEFSFNLVGTVIANEIIEPLLIKAKSKKESPEWDKIESYITKKYGENYAATQITEAKYKWFLRLNEWVTVCEILVKKIELIGEIKKASWGTLNTSAWIIFQYSYDKRQLEKALIWSDAAIDSYRSEKGRVSASLIDTKANILYKLGRIKEAVTNEEYAIGLAPKYAELKITMDKMKQGLPTWQESN
jgi:thiol-disulfide isomerase/thioredoxin